MTICDVNRPDAHVLVFQCDNRPSLDYLQKTMAVNRACAQQMGWNYMFRTLHVPSCYEPPLCKIFEVRDLLKQAHNYKWIIFMDSDAWIQNQHALQHLLLNLSEKKHGMFSRDPYVKSETYINSGSFVLRVDQFTRKMYDDIYNLIVDATDDATNENHDYLTTWPYDQKFISDFVHNQRNHFAIYKPNVLNTPQGKIIRHSWPKEFETCRIHDCEIRMSMRNILDNRPYPNPIDSEPWDSQMWK